MSVYQLCASDHDRLWFEKHPDRRYRMRRPLPGEPELLQIAVAPHETPVVIVQQIASGIRLRVPVGLTGWPPVELREWDGFVEGILGLVRSVAHDPR